VPHQFYGILVGTDMDNTSGSAFDAKSVIIIQKNISENLHLVFFVKIYKRIFFRAQGMKWQIQLTLWQEKLVTVIHFN
jgi:hypothetical protein